AVIEALQGSIDCANQGVEFLGHMRRGQTDASFRNVDPIGFGSDVTDAAKLPRDDPGDDEEGHERQHGQQTDEYRVAEDFEDHLETKLWAATGDNPELARIAVMAAHNGARSFSWAYIGNISGIQSGDVIQEIFKALRDGAQLRGVAF